MELKYLNAFVCVAREGSLNAAAACLFLSPPALAQQINQLEAELGVSLFKRSPRGVRLTPAGQTFLDGALRILDLTGSVFADTLEVAQGRCGTFRIGSITGLVPDFFPAIKAAAKRCLPDITLDHAEGPADRLIAQLIDETIDMLEYYDAPQLDALGLAYTPLLREGRDCLICPDHPLARLPILTPDDLCGQILHVFCYERVPGLQAFFAREYPGVCLEEGTSGASNYYTVLDLCASGRVCLIPPHCAHRFVPLLVRPLHLPMSWTSGLIYRKDSSAQLKQLLEFSVRLFSDCPNVRPIQPGR